MNLGMPEMMFIFLLALILFGPKKLPEIGREIGKFMAEFKRASNDFKYQFQSEIEKVGADIGPASPAGAQQTSSFTQTLLPPAVTSAISEIDNAHERLMQTARMAFEAQNFTLRPPDAPVVAAIAPESSAALPNADALSAVPSDGVGEFAEASPLEDASQVKVAQVEAVTDRPTPDSAQAKRDSDSQSS